MDPHKFYFLDGLANLFHVSSRLGEHWWEIVEQEEGGRKVILPSLWLLVASQRVAVTAALSGQPLFLPSSTSCCGSSCWGLVTFLLPVSHQTCGW